MSWETCLHAWCSWPYLHSLCYLWHWGLSPHHSTHTNLSSVKSGLYCMYCLDCIKPLLLTILFYQSLPLASATNLLMVCILFMWINCFSVLQPKGSVVGWRVPPEKYVQVLTTGTRDWDFIWKLGLYRCNQVKMSLGWALIWCAWCPSKKSKHPVRHRHIERRKPCNHGGRG